MERIRKQAADISAESDPEGKAALETSLKMMEERYNRIKHLVEDGGEQLEVSVIYEIPNERKHG